MLTKKENTKSWLSNRNITIYGLSIWGLLILMGILSWNDNHTTWETLRFVLYITFWVWIPTYLLILTN